MIEVLAQAPGSWGNPSSLHMEGRVARNIVETARHEVAQLLSVRPEEIVFTSGGTEGNNTALLGAVREVFRRTDRRDQVLTSPLEHPSVKAALHALSEEGHPVTFLPVDRLGRLDPEDLLKALRDRPTALVSLALVNHEIGNLYPIPQMARICRERGVLFHCDAVQAAGRVPVDLADLGVDMLTLSGHKLHGPKGIGALYLRSGSSGSGPLLVGGKQEKGRRAGTENVPGIVGLGVACRLSRERLPQRSRHIADMRDRLERQLLDIKGAHLHGDPHPAGRAPGTCNVGFDGVEGELMMMNLDLCGVAVSTGAACSSGSTEPSPVLLALGLPAQQALQAVRFSLGGDNTAAEVDRVAAAVREHVARIRAISSPHP